MNFEQAVRASIKAYFEETNYMTNLKEHQKRMKYSKKYFDSIETERFGSPTDIYKKD